MKRNLEQLANYLVENGALLSREQSYIQKLHRLYALCENARNRTTDFPER